MEDVTLNSVDDYKLAVMRFTTLQIGAENLYIAKFKVTLSLKCYMLQTYSILATAIQLFDICLKRCNFRFDRSLLYARKKNTFNSWCLIHKVFPIIANLNVSIQS